MPVLSPTIWIVLVAATLQCLTGLGWWMTSHKLDSTLDKLSACQLERRQFENDVRTAGELAKRRVLIEQQKSEQVTREVSHAYQTRLDALRADYERLRKRTAVSAGSSGVQSFPIAAARVDEIPADAVPIAAACAETTLQLTELQGWIVQQKGAKDD